MSWLGWLPEALSSGENTEPLTRPRHNFRLAAASKRPSSNTVNSKPPSEVALLPTPTARTAQRKRPGLSTGVGKSPPADVGAEKHPEAGVRVDEPGHPARRRAGSRVETDRSVRTVQDRVERWVTVAVVPGPAEIVGWSEVCGAGVRKCLWQNGCSLRAGSAGPRVRASRRRAADPSPRAGSPRRPGSAPRRPGPARSSPRRIASRRSVRCPTHRRGCRAGTRRSRAGVWCRSWGPLGRDDPVPGGTGRPSSRENRREGAGSGLLGFGRRTPALGRPARPIPCAAVSREGRVRALTARAERAVVAQPISASAHFFRWKASGLPEDVHARRRTAAWQPGRGRGTVYGSRMWIPWLVVLAMVLFAIVTMTGVDAYDRRRTR